MDDILFYVRRFQNVVLPENQLGMAEFYRTQLYYLRLMRDSILDMIETNEYALRNLEDI
jgi:hypothetical protein